MTDVVHRRVAIGMLLGGMVEDGAFPTDWTPDSIREVAADLQHDRFIVDGLRGVLERFGAIEPGAPADQLVPMLEILLPPD